MEFDILFIVTYKRNDNQKIDKAIAQSLYIIENRFQAFRGGHTFHGLRQ